MSVSVNENVFKGMEDIMNSAMLSVVRRLSEEYGFDCHDACEKIGLISLSKEKGEKKEKPAKSESEKKEKPAKSESKKIPFPFMGKIIADKCKAVKLNHGLYTQCANPICEGDLCKGCKEECDKNSSGDPANGFINRRMMMGDNYVDSKGKKPIAYSKVLQKLKLTKETVLEEAKKQGIELNDSHFSVPPRAKAGRKKKSESSTSAITSDTDSDADSSRKEKRGRPKKQSSKVEVEEDDLFARLVDESSQEKKEEEQVVLPAPVVVEIQTPVVVEIQTPVVVEAKKEESSSKPKKEKKGLVIEGDEDKKAKKKEKKDKAERLEKERLEKEKREKEQAERLEKERLEKERLEKERLEKEKREKEQAELLAELSDVSDDDEEEEEEEEDEEDDENAPPVEVVSTFKHNGKNYLKSENNVVYDVETQDAIGVWNPEKKMIELHELEEESDYESDDE
jgi:hypothetical protein